MMRAFSRISSFALRCSSLSLTYPVAAKPIAKMTNNTRLNFTISFISSPTIGKPETVFRRSCRFRRILIGMQNRVPLGMLVEMILQRFAESGVFETRLETLHEARAPGLFHRQPGLNFGIGNLMIGLGRYHLAGKNGHPRRQRVSKRTWYGCEKSWIRARVDRDVFARPTRKKLPRAGAVSMAPHSIMTCLADVGRSG